MTKRSPAAHATYCRKMAMRTYALADAAEDFDMIEAYVDIAAKWFRLAERALASQMGDGDQAAHLVGPDVQSLALVAADQRTDPSATHWSAGRLTA